MQPEIGSFAQYLYFVFSPTLLYRDSYPRCVWGGEGGRRRGGRGEEGGERRGGEGRGGEEGRVVLLSLFSLIPGALTR